jgi:hypothetical protein
MEVTKYAKITEDFSFRVLRENFVTFVLNPGAFASC